ncbi:MAG TPA: transketolase C-terminal domain-containing protein [Pirellulales bacterium]|nr:transketolase C-terminal domain-containing protein [Pirellulales bacterium]
MRDEFVGRLTQMAERDARIMLVTGDLGFGVLTEFARRFPRQFVNAGVAEQNMTSLATGLALEGYIVFTYSIANFAFMRCLEQIRNDAAYHRANVNVVAIGGGLSYGQLGVSHHATEDISIMRAIPELMVVCPGDAWEAAEAAEAVAQQPGASYIRLDRSSAQRMEQPGDQFILGKARIVRTGTDVALLAAGGILSVAHEAASQLALEGIQCQVISMHTLKPFDEEAVLDAARQTSGIVTLEEHTVDGGLGSAVAERLLEQSCIPGFFYRVGLRGDFPSVVGSQAYLRQLYGLDAASVAVVVANLVRGLSASGRRQLAA